MSLLMGKDMKRANLRARGDGVAIEGLQLSGWHAEYAERASARAKSRRPGRRQQSAGDPQAAVVLTVAG